MASLTALNGRLPDAMLAVIDRSGHRLRTDAAASYARASAAYGSPLAVISAYRTLLEQQQLWDGYANHLLGYSPANRPGTSQHGEGLAVDLTGAASIAWMAAHGAAHGWAQTYRASEPWHFDYDPARDQYRTEATSSITGGFLMALSDQQQDQLYAWMEQAVGGIGKLDERSLAADRLWGDRSPRPFNVDDTHDKVLEIHHGVGIIQSLAEAQAAVKPDGTIDSAAVDAIATQIAAALGAHFDVNLTVTPKP